MIEQAFRRELWEVGLPFELLLFSFELGSVKPDPAIFRAALERVGCGPEEALFIADVRANVDAATALGITSLLFSDARALEADLVRLRILPESWR